ncbi:MAG: CRISPR-associated helicase/endonuclease Cas3 [Deltaproteobacteria bacterium CG12_big_fil_rev_8_21_14_0_65_43_10]|nr:MAG: CRISPR-associated helicase/endonuclease Cas3 [Deltaproteobacteria bacterium CG2_30_43_15]PIQ45352.1 MAG: CRISPR-associated helicase/endonuclease Cas3 [Deltaproteobacteria bacterium CG12_big_fil_rev_8_21_14_0_65_43_10]PIU86462.1 MAG: CRISPR-associated helicase/endonuclease Cas3 [Deltaproteobacteria bacterium CG06_land_8_20_14_3_00_44_19]PIX25760.1 MAG: CRISPR-associated helicase/endonuclease Cas3 [Deltaproteobacteria bacterium CG_4_8_14_3_um_filter_43_13]PIZ19960.1 MAG: CRISPR-associated
MSELYAHTPNDEGKWHLLDKHLRDVAEIAQGFADKFCAGNLAYWIGLWHDLGKCNPKFQEYLKACQHNEWHEKVPHAIWGAVLTYRLLSHNIEDDRWKEMALTIAGHHGRIDQPGSLSQRLEEHVQSNHKIFQHVVDYVKKLPSPPKVTLPKLTRTQRELFIRMVFSALVDADYLNTEKHFKENQYILRHKQQGIEHLWDRFIVNQLEFISSVNATTIVNQVRKEVYEFCEKAATGNPGIYRMTVPTGGGKTRSSLAFALKHAVENKMDRIVFAIPYTSIIDQTAREYRKILGADAVLEHHSQVNIPANENQDAPHISLRLAHENWDTPLIVTTTVQLFESLFSNRPGKVRKLHNLARSVIVLDEVQTLPLELLTPTLDVLRELIERYRVSVVLCTATQPAFEDSHYLKPFHRMQIREIVPKEIYQKHFKRLKRVEYHRRKEPVSWQELADELSREKQVMVVLNTRKDALSLVDALGNKEDAFHLSTLLCGIHRKLVLREVKRRLKNGLPVRLISTQVIEAGVDIDFPVVYRAIGPLDRIVQAAGRCNREGKLSQDRPGRVIIFEPLEGRTPRGTYKTGIEKAKLLLMPPRDIAELHNPELYRIYFEKLFADVDTDKKKIQSHREVLDYPTVDSEYRLIEQNTVPVLINSESTTKRLKEWKYHPCRRTWQRLQPLLLNMFDYEVQKFKAEGWLEPVSEGLYLSFGMYDRLKGLVPAIYDPSDLIQ